MVLCDCVGLIHLLHTELKQNETSINLALTQWTGNETPYQLSHHQIKKDLNMSANSKMKSTLLKSLILEPK
jgi:hypothetical protein